jgi:hypothetical protein
LQKNSDAWMPLMMGSHEAETQIKHFLKLIWSVCYKALGEVKPVAL